MWLGNPFMACGLSAYDVALFHLVLYHNTKHFHIFQYEPHSRRVGLARYLESSPIQPILEALGMLQEKKKIKYMQYLAVAVIAQWLLVSHVAPQKTRIYIYIVVVSICSNVLFFMDSNDRQKELIKKLLQDKLREITVSISISISISIHFVFSRALYLQYGLSIRYLILRVYHKLISSAYTVTTFFLPYTLGPEGRYMLAYLQSLVLMIYLLSKKEYDREICISELRAGADLYRSVQIMLLILRPNVNESPDYRLKGILARLEVLRRVAFQDALQYITTCDKDKDKEKEPDKITIFRKHGFSI
ncbi:hypothetical protein ACJX0J_036141 [Zea mays]